MENWNKWYEKNKESVLESFGGFIKELKVGDMDLNTYCRFKFFEYQNEEKLKDTYNKNKEDKGATFEKAFPSEIVYRLSVFAQVEKQDAENNQEEVIA